MPWACMWQDIVAPHSRHTQLVDAYVVHEILVVVMMMMATTVAEDDRRARRCVSLLLTPAPDWRARRCLRACQAPVSRAPTS